MARVVRTERRQRGCLGSGFLALFWLFNAVMAYAMFTGLRAAGEVEVGSPAEAAGRSIGTFVGSTMLMSIWGAGALVLGLCVLLTRGNRVVVEEDGEAQEAPREPLVINAAPVRALPRSEPRVQSRKPPPQLDADRGWFVEIVGEASYQDNIAAAVAHAEGEFDGRPMLVVTLEPEDDNPHDEDAVRVDAAGRTIGYLPPPLAREYRKALGARRSGCTALAYLGGADDGEARYGVWLNAAWPPRYR